MTLTATCWGVRGSIATPGPATVGYGGNTPCVALENAAGDTLILDAGTGIRPLGAALVARQHRGRIDILLSHTHWDHIQGLPFFAPLYHPEFRIKVHGPAPDGTSLRSVLQRQMDPVVFPVALTRVAARLSVGELEPGRSTVGPWQVDAVRLQHPGTTLGFRIRATPDSAGLSYLTDNELGATEAGGLDPGWYQKLVQEVAGADVLIHDAMYDEATKPDRVGWGHSTPLEAVALARASGVRRLVLFHHDPDHDDAAVERLLAEARGAAAGKPDLEVLAAREGMALTL